MGSNFPDSLDVELLAPEFKYYKKLVVKEEDFQQAVTNAARIGKIPMLAIKEHGGKRKRAIMDWDDFVTIYNLAKEAYLARTKDRGLHSDP